MQAKSLIPTPLSPAREERWPIELAQSKLPSRFRIFHVALFIGASILRSLAAKLLGSLAKKRYSAAANAQRLRAFMEKMGGLWVKAGQVVALRRDLFSEELCNELSRMQDRARGFDGAQARRVVEAELGRPLDEVFIEFDTAPLAAASIGQVHRARLRSNQVEVVVKVRRPHIVQSFATDLRIIKRYVRLLTGMGIMPQMRWRDLYEELERAILEELDYRQEASSIRRMRKNLRRHKFYAPTVFLEYCSEQILVMELVRGVYMSEYIQTASRDPARVHVWLKENNINPQRIGERLLFSHLRQLLEENLFHCDLHPGNILLLRNSRATLIDFGSVGTIDRSQLTKVLHMFRALAVRDYHKVADLWILLSPSPPPNDISEIRDKIVRLYREFESRAKIKSIPYHQKSIGHIANQVMRYATSVGLHAAWDMLRMIRAELTLDASLMVLNPGVNYPKLTGKYLRQFAYRSQQQLCSRKNVRTQLVKMSQLMDAPARLAADAYFDGEYLRRRALRFGGFLSKGADIARRFFSALAHLWMLVALAAGVACLHQRFDAFRVLRGTWGHILLARIPPHEPAVWIAAMLLALYFRHEFVQITTVLSKAEPSSVGGDRR